MQRDSEWELAYSTPRDEVLSYTSLEPCTSPQKDWLDQKLLQNRLGQESYGTADTVSSTQVEGVLMT